MTYKFTNTGKEFDPNEPVIRDAIISILLATGIIVEEAKEPEWPVEINYEGDNYTLMIELPRDFTRSPAEAVRDEIKKLIKEKYGTRN